MDRTDLHEDKSDELKFVEKPLEIRKGWSNAGVRLKAGATIGKYELLQEIGSGAMSVVYKARDLALNRHVAIKFLLTDALDGAEFQARFKLEAQALGTLEHANIVKVHEIDVTTDGAPYLVMNYLSGSTLADYLAIQGRLPPERWLAIMLQVCAALEHAHASGIIHRDIKPSNFVLADENGIEIVKLIDFGIAKNLLDETALTKTGKAFGTPLYMSPEQCAGGKLDVRSDIYSLGCVLYEALAGQAPLVGENSLSTMQKHLKNTPEPLLGVLSTSIQDRTQLTCLNRVVMKCLEKKPEDRYQNISDIRGDLNSISQGSKLSIRLAPRGRTKRIGIVAMIGISISITVITVLQITKKQNSPAVHSEVSLETVSPKVLTSTKESATESNDNSKTNTVESRVIVNDLLLFQNKEKLLRHLNKQVRGLMHDAQWELALPKSKQLLAICVETNQQPWMKAQIYWRIGLSEYHLYDLPAARRDFQLALNEVAGKPDNDSKDWEYQALIYLGLIANYDRDYSKAIDYYGQAFKTIQTRQPVSKYSTVKGKELEENQILKHKAICMQSIGDIYYTLRKFDQCKTYWEASLKFRPEDPKLVKKLKNLDSSTTR